MMNVKLSNSQFRNLDPQVIIETLARHINASRQHRIEETLNKRLLTVQLALESPADLHNVFACIRTCEALGVARIHIISPEGKHVSGKSVSKGAQYWIDIHFHPSWEDFLKTVQPELVLAAALPKATATLDQVPIEKPLCLVLGNEQRGLSANALKASSIHYQIPLFGMTQSLNLSVSAAISLYDVTSRKRGYLQREGDLNDDQKRQLRAQYCLNSVDPRILDALIRQQF